MRLLHGNQTVGRKRFCLSIRTYVDSSWMESNWIHENEVIKNNLILEYVDFVHNKIKMINPNLFANLDYLLYVIFAENDCVNSKFVYENTSLTIINEKLKV
jgi:hypothetical protein